MVGWIPKGIDFDAYGDDPSPTPQEAALRMVQDSNLETTDDDQWYISEELIRYGFARITVLGCIETAEPLDPDYAFDGYEPGQSYWKYTGEEREVIVRLSAELMPSRNKGAAP